MNSTQHQRTTTRFGCSAEKFVLLCAFALALLGPALVRGQDVELLIGTAYEQDCVSKGLGYTFLPGIVQLNDRTIQTSGNTGAKLPVSPGTYRIKGALPARPNAKLASLGYLAKMFYPDDSGTVTLDITNYKEQSLTLFFKDCTSLVTVKTTESCTPDPKENVSRLGNVSVLIGNKSLTTDASGFAETHLPMGTYQVSATWKDAAFGFVKHQGIEKLYSEKGWPSVELVQKTEELEIRMATCVEGGRKERAKVTEMGESMVVKRFSRTSGEFTQQRAFVGMILRDGDEVQIIGRGKLQWLEGGTVTFDDPKSTRIRIGPERPEDTEARSTLHLYIGFVKFFVPKSEPSKKYRFEASTGTVKTSVRGTIYSLRHDDKTQKSIVGVEEGEVEVTPMNHGLRPLTLTANQEVEVSLSSVGIVRPMQTAVDAFRWVSLGTGDCGGYDIGQTTGSALPEANKCSAATAGTIAVCWDGKQYSNGGSDQWCTYKSKAANPCRGGRSPGFAYECRSGKEKFFIDDIVLPSGLNIRTQKSVYGTNEQVVVQYSGLPGHAKDWISVVSAGSADNVYSEGRWAYTDGKKSGTYTFSPLPAGRYEARVYFNWDAAGGSYVVQARNTFEVRP